MGRSATSSSSMRLISRSVSTCNTATTPLARTKRSSKVEGTAHLMDDLALRDVVSFGNEVVPTTWMTSEGELLPMEFATMPVG